MRTFYRSLQTLLPLLAAVLLAAPAAQARPEMAGRQNATARFERMDADKNGTLSREEFFAAQPDMKEGAFAAIDADKDGRVSASEWEGFAAGHGREEAHMPGAMPRGTIPQAPAPEAKITPKASEKSPGQAPALIMPPARP